MVSIVYQVLWKFRKNKTVGPQERKVAWQGLGNTHDCPAEFPGHRTNMLMHPRQVTVQVCTVSM
jgi:hypothetical protein